MPLRPDGRCAPLAAAPLCAFVALATLLFVPSQALAALRYRVDLAVPDAYRALLTDNLEIYRWRGNPAVNEAFLRQVFGRTPQEIRRLLSTQGYYSPTITSRLARANGVWVAHFAVAPGEPVKVSRVDITIEGQVVREDPSRLPKLKDAWTLKTGEVFRTAQWEAAKRALLRSLMVDRYPGARLVATRALVDPRQHTAALSVTVNSGPPYAFGTLVIRGLKRYPARVVSGLNPIRPGSPYEQAALLRLQRRLQASGYFAQVVVTAPISNAPRQAIPVQVDVIENRLQDLAFGVGYSTDTGPRGSIGYADRNLFGRAWVLTGGVLLDTVDQSLTAGIALPTTGGDMRNSVVGVLARSDNQGQIADTTQVSLNHERPLGPFDLLLSLAFTHEVQHLSGAPTQVQRALALNSSWTRRVVDNALYPTRGYVLNLQLGGADKILLTDQSFVRAYAKAIGYVPVSARGDLIMRGEFGAVISASRAGIPSNYLFLAGGDQSVRGYAYQSLGVTEGNAIVGGRYLGVVSAEYDYWFLPRWGAAVFYDVGDVADEPHALKWAQGYGVGARWRSPVGPVALDLAYGEQRHALRVHLSVGVGF